MKIGEISGFIYKKLKDINYINKKAITKDLIDNANIRYTEKKISQKNDLTFLIAFLNFSKIPLEIED